MRNLWTLWIALALAVPGCAGAYDRELLGDPQPVAVAPPAETRSTETVAPDEYAGSEDVEPLYDTPADYGMFNELDPYGGWYQSSRFGSVWRPSVMTGWQPYYDGHWIWTSYGWMWVSYEPFGWATYHYGSWWLDPMLGWIWVPDYQWSPCPVEWFVVGGYVGWAPRPPRGCSWDDPWNDRGRYRDGWVVIETGKFKDIDVGKERVSLQKFKSAYRSGTAVRQAPETRTIERATRQSVKQTNVRIDARRVGDRELKKVVLPDHERQIVDRFPMQVVPPSGTMTRPIRSSGNNELGPPPNSKDGKTKDTVPPPGKETKPPAKVKSKGSSGAARDSGKAKDGSKDDKKDSDEKSKGDSKGGDDKSKGDSKDRGSNGGKAKGKRG